jgi:hypothetical protein
MLFLPLKNKLIMSFQATKEREIPALLNSQSALPEIPLLQQAQGKPWRGMTFSFVNRPSSIAGYRLPASP